MPLFHPLTDPTQLPATGHGAETYIFDIKQNIDKPFNYFEMAKDVCAFSNSTGGVILVGAAEDRKRGTIGKYLPLDEKDAKKIRDAYSTAVRAHCSPVPVINPVILPQSGAHVVAVNVWAFPGQAVGLQLRSDPHAYKFPFRTGVDTSWMSAEQLRQSRPAAGRIPIASVGSILPRALACLRRYAAPQPANRCAQPGLSRSPSAPLLESLVWEDQRALWAKLQRVPFPCPTEIHQPASSLSALHRA